MPVPLVLRDLLRQVKEKQDQRLPAFHSSPKETGTLFAQGVTPGCVVRAVARGDGAPSLPLPHAAGERNPRLQARTMVQNLGCLIALPEH